MMTVTQAARAASRRKASVPASVHTCFRTDITPLRGRRRRGRWDSNLATDTASGYTNRRDFQSKAMFAGPSSAFAVSQGNATATTATTLTAPTGFPTSGQGLAGCIVVAGPNASGTGSKVYGVIVSNTATVLTVDQWYDPTSTTGAAGTTPNATASYVVVPGQNPASWIALTADAAAASSADTTLASEQTGSDFKRAVGTYSHTAAASTAVLAHTFTAASTVTLNKYALFGACNTTGGGVMPFESVISSPPPMLSGDTAAVTVTITI